LTIGLLANIDVGDLEQAIAFYRDGLGLRLERRLGKGVAEMLGASSPIYLLAKPPGSAASAAAPQPRDYARHWTPVHLDFVVKDIDAAVARALSAGAKAEGGIQVHNWGKIALMADPFGNGFCLIEFSARGYDEIAS
jgi:predicted enzyme related to lactoylglutathione lyase